MMMEVKAKADLELTSSLEICPRVMLLSHNCLEGWVIAEHLWEDTPVTITVILEQAAML